MQGTSPAMQSPSFHSSSYLPKMEANFMKDFTCCGLTLDSLHELLQHFEEAHAQAPGQNLPRTSTSGHSGLPQKPGAMPASSSRATQADPAAFTQHGFQTTPRPQPTQYNIARSQRLGSDGFSKTNLSTVHDMDNVEDMEMDDVGVMPSIDEQHHFDMQQQQHFSNLPQLNVNLANLQNQGLRNSNPNTPLATASPFGLQHNPTVSSVNTPTLSTAPLQQQSRTPDSSTPGTPAEFDPDYTMGLPGGLPMNNQMNGMNGLNGMNGMNGDLNFNMNFGTGMGGAFDGTIDQPAKRLFSKNGSGVTQAQLAMAIRSAQGAGDVQLQNQLLAKMQGLQQQEEVKPFRCPVIGCEKAYKNQNGLKYHKTHGHQNQKLKENDNGTFSIVDPVTSVPYPGSMGMEKEKPYRCDYCGKRYKNLNGLKYHRQHSANCNPDLVNQLGPLNGLQNIQGLNVNVAGAGLSGIEGSMF
ncbi:hypothetical protein EJ05DRAFT_358977 [Pseudovirgaria hyperparasitica]|uniref:C2H2-type domain-containing protein n=1 Tax=Pseudovirgaria hyperparasitica TaxID=470096 RepID=A0A6A6W7K6_9PEZI|nr:uncharacterized protein EJ05DRAFT_358977 [Pseudovirgaria hyperparasitica]KAF2758613.1 hypothetical protein EJ05DRAFT_358977 [Pseudovirgaria hyperparasitica]